MGPKRTEEFRQDPVQIALTSGLTRMQVADDLGFGMSTLNKWTGHTETLTWYRKRIYSSPKRMTGYGARTAISRRKAES